MKSVNVYEMFINVLNERVPQKPALVNKLANLLVMEKESVYRRLRGDVPFTFMETGVIARELNISLDEIIKVSGKSEYYSLQFTWNWFRDIDNSYYQRLVDYMSFLERISGDEASEAGTAMNALHPSLYYNYEGLSSFFTFKWHHRYVHELQYRHYEETAHDSRISELKKDIDIYIRRIQSKTYVWDIHVIKNLVKDIKYFETIHLIGKESILKLKYELIEMLDKIEKQAILGMYPDTGNQFELYIADFNIEQTCTYLGAGESCLSILTTFELQSCTSLSRTVYESLKNWVMALKRLSTKISVAAEKERIQFFDAQRFIVESL